MRAWMMLVAVVALTAACELQLDVQATVDRNGAGQVTVALSADDELRAQAAAAGVYPLDELVESGDALGDGWSVEDRTAEDGLRTVALSRRFDDPQAFDALAAELAAALSAPEVELLAPLSLTVTDERVRIHGAAGLQPTDAVAELGLSPEQAVAALHEAAVGYDVRVVMPGDVLASTADARDGQALVWTVPAGQRVDIEALGERPDPARWPLFASALLGMLAAAALLGLVTRRRARRSR